MNHVGLFLQHSPKVGRARETTGRWRAIVENRTAIGPLTSVEESFFGPRPRLAVNSRMRLAALSSAAEPPAAANVCKSAFVLPSMTLDTARSCTQQPWFKRSRRRAQRVAADLHYVRHNAVDLRPCRPQARGVPPSPRSHSYAVQTVVQNGPDHQPGHSRYLTPRNASGGWYPKSLAPPLPFTRSTNSSAVCGGGHTASYVGCEKIIAG